MNHCNKPLIWCLIYSSMQYPAWRQFFVEEIDIYQQMPQCFLCIYSPMSTWYKHLPEVMSTCSLVELWDAFYFKASSAFHWRLCSFNIENTFLLMFTIFLLEILLWNVLLKKVRVTCKLMGFLNWILLSDWSFVLWLIFFKFICSFRD